MWDKPISEPVIVAQGEFVVDSLKPYKVVPGKEGAPILSNLHVYEWRGVVPQKKFRMLLSGRRGNGSWTVKRCPLQQQSISSWR